MQTNKNESLNIICFNEFNFNLWTKELGCTLPAKKIYSGQIRDSHTSGFLEPWSQWPSFFYGSDALRLDIKELGQTPKDRLLKPLWDRDKNSKNLIIGMMNATTEYPNKNLLIPDPWTVDLKSLPKDFQKLGESMNNVATNYLNLSILEKLTAFISVAKLLKYVGFIYFFKILIFGLYWGFKTKFKNLVFIGMYELILLKVAISLKEANKYDRTILFFNIFAHIQHHHWKFKNDKPSIELCFGKEVFIKMIKALKYKGFFDEKFIIHNALNQENCINKEDWVLYRPKSHKLLFEKLLDTTSFDICEAMTNDGYINFDSDQDANNNILKLNNWFLNDEKLLNLSRKNNKVFYRLNFVNSVSNNVIIYNLDKSKKLYFFDFFKFVTRRTGRHIQSFNFATNINGLYYPGIDNANLGTRVFR